MAQGEDLLFITLRHRYFHAARTLENIVNDVQKELPAIKTFHCIFCRAVPGFTTFYNAEHDYIAPRTSSGGIGSWTGY